MIQGARLAGATQIIAVDVNPTKLQWAKDFGATHTVDAKSSDPVEAVRKLTDDGWDGGVEYAFEATGIPKCTEGTCAVVVDGNWEVNGMTSRRWING